MKGNKAGHMKGPMAPNGPMMANGPMGPCGHMGPGGEMGHMVRLGLVDPLKLVEESFCLLYAVFSLAKWFKAMLLMLHL